jgi:hypothetical protein
MLRSSTAIGFTRGALAAWSSDTALASALPSVSIQRTLRGHSQIVSTSQRFGSTSPSRSDSRAASATAIAPYSALGSLCVRREEARTWASIEPISSIAAPRIAARIAGPLPAENTPAFSGDAPSHSLAPLRAVALPTPAGKDRIHHRSRIAKRPRNRSTSPPASISD